MSFIIKGIDLPKDTFGVKVTFQCYSENNTFGTIIISHTEEKYAMLDDIIQIPKGARLIDANEVKNDMMNAMCMTGYQSRAMDVIEFASTILEDEEDCD